MEPWTYDHIHEKPKQKHRLARAIICVALAWGCVLVGTVGAAQSAKSTMKRVKKRLVR